ncbi:hypothetical protein ACQPWY_00715 [Pseudonocardia xinjiangensis]|uniref:hypothetical protein n=1 Tax=Pseudonocardia xinjiangensis TaxID=75289 RepID=UPI003D8E2617
MPPEQPTPAGDLDAETPAFAQRMFDPARDGRTDEPAAARGGRSAHATATGRRARRILELLHGRHRP